MGPGGVHVRDEPRLHPLQGGQRQPGRALRGHLAREEEIQSRLETLHLIANAFALMPLSFTSIFIEPIEDFAS